MIENQPITALYNPSVPAVPANVTDVPGVEDPRRLAAGFWWRSVAALLDLAFFVAFFSVGLAILQPLVAKVTGSGLIWATHPGVVLICSFIYYAIPEASAGGATLGKKLVGLRVVRSAGAPLTLSRASLRHLVRVAGSFVFLAPLLFVCLNTQKRGLHDVLVGAVVVRRKSGFERWLARREGALTRWTLWGFTNLGAPFVTLVVLTFVVLGLRVILSPLLHFQDAQRMIVDSLNRAGAAPTDRGRLSGSAIAEGVLDKSAATTTNFSVRSGKETGSLVITYGTGSALLSGKSINLVPEMQGGRNVWRCSSNSITQSLLPAVCTGVNANTEDAR